MKPSGLIYRYNSPKTWDPRPWAATVILSSQNKRFEATWGHLAGPWSVL